MGDTQRAGSSAPAARAALPGLVGLDHVGLTVPDIEQATRFLVDVLGCEPALRAWPRSPGAASGCASTWGSTRRPR
nr:hypothetical protein [Angustibacter aerolatus]